MIAIKLIKSRAIVLDFFCILWYNVYRKLRKGDLYDAALQNIDIFYEEEEETMKENKDGTHIGELLLATFL